MTTHTKDMRLVMIAPWLPKLSETFVYREVFGLRQAGFEVQTVSVHDPGPAWKEADLKDLADKAVRVYGPGPVPMLLDSFAAFLSHPLRSSGTMALIIRDALTASDIKGFYRLKILWQGLAGMALSKRLKNSKPDHIHAHMAHVPATIAMYAAKQLGIGFSFTGHAADIFRDRSLLRQKLERADFIRCISFWHRDFYKSIADRPDIDYPVIRCGVDIHRPISPAGPQLKNTFQVMGVGRLVPKKGFDLLLSAADLLRRAGLNCRYRIIGDGPERSRLEKLSETLGLQDMVSFEGAMTNSEILDLLPRADIFVLPCRTDSSGDKDGIPVVLMEAMACGVCCVSGDLPAIRELIDSGRNGFLVPPEDISALAGCLEKLLADEGLREKTAAKGRLRIIEEFSMDLNIQRLGSALLNRR
jgi:colanic acid/amylovoran biosynthesis glycosyltransferase